MKANLILGSILVLLIAGGVLITGSNTEEESGKPGGTTPIVANKTYAVKIPESLSFAGEQVPLTDYNVKERLDREMLINTYWHSSTIYLFKQANRYFPIIEPLLKENNIPEDFKYLALAESGLQNLVSPSNAVGVWQFIKATGKSYDLEITTEVDERYHLEKATIAACRYLKGAHEMFGGDWTMAAASYNMGMENLQKVQKKQQVKSYYDIHLNTQTSRYVFRILAFKEIFENPVKYGFMLDEDDLYQPIGFKTVMVDSALNDLATFAIIQGTNYKTLRLLNPWLRRGYLKNVNRKRYEIKLPS
jgi:membrane-bound lytic murein transglycosylase D